MSDNIRVRRSPEELVAAKTAELERAKARAAVDAQMSHPSVQALSAILTETAKARTEAKKGYNGNPNQTFANRIQSHTLWNAEIEAEKAVADAQIALSDFIVPLYRALRTNVATMLANGQSVDGFISVETQAIEDSANAFCAELNDAQAMLSVAHAAREAFVKSKQTPKAATTNAAV